MIYAAIAVIILALIVLVGLNLNPPGTPTSQATPIPTQNLDAVRTEAVETFAAGLTETASSAPTATATDTEAATLEAAVSTAISSGPSPTAGPSPTGGPSPTPACLGLRYVRDVTIPDNTPMTPAQVFTKSWLVENSGTCPWQAGFQVVLIGGEAMGASPFPVVQNVAPGGRIQISIKMVAPTNETGIVQGTWKMADLNGKAFGDYMSVVIVVGSGTGAARTSVPTVTGTP